MQMSSSITYKNGNQYWENFLMHPKFRILRHLLILLLLGIIVMRGLFESTEFSPGWNVITLINITLIFLFWGIICLNTYVLIPHFLFKGKYWTYSVCLLACTLLPLFMMFLVIFISKFYFPAFHEAIKPECNLFLFFFINFLGIFFYISAFSMTIFLQRWTMHSRQLQELEKNKVQNELDRLKDQVQPDFLSRMLNTANVLAKKDADKASSLLLRLGYLLRYQLYDSTREKVLLSADISFIRDYMNLEKIHNDRFNFNITTDKDIEHVMVPPLLFIPIIEHALGYIRFHETDKLPDIYLLFKMKNDNLYFACIYPPGLLKESANGLYNLHRRLQLLYGENFSLETKQGDKNNITSLQICL